MIAFRYIALSDAGRNRSDNQDVVRVLSLNENTLIALLCDGMGGHQGGELAAHTATDTILKAWRRQKVTADESSMGEAWRHAFLRAHQQIAKHAESDSRLAFMGTTCVGLLLSSVQERIFWASLGDSRLYLLRNQELQQISEDHTFVENLVRSKEISKEEARVHPKSHILEKALGGGESTPPDVGSLETQPDDCWLLCSDGLTRMLTDEEIRQVLLQPKDDIEEVAMSLIQQANLAGGLDNVSVSLLVVE
ncbi:MAG: Stp1/IreP family PP2C-type Ser/Thr phosphatase [Bacteroidota bacterium]